MSLALLGIVLTYNLSTQEVEVGDLEVEASLSYTVSLGPAWAA